MSQQKLLACVITALESCGIAYMATGSIVSSLQGEPRMTHDIDLVVDVQPSHVAPLMAAFPAPGFYLAESGVQLAIRHQQMFNLLVPDTGEKVDFWLLTGELFDQSRFARRMTLTINDLSLIVSSPEDTILAKLRWAKLAGGSEKQHQDALRVYEIQFAELDQAYLNHWSHALGVADLLARVRNEAQVI